MIIRRKQVDPLVTFLEHCQYLLIVDLEIFSSLSSIALILISIEAAGIGITVCFLNGLPMD